MDTPRGIQNCEEDTDMNFTAFSTGGAAGTHFVTTTGQLPKIQQNISNNGTAISQVVGMVGGMGEGVQYMRTLDGGATLQATPQIISLPISLPGAKPGDPQPTVQIQVLNPSLLQPQQPPKYQMQIPIQGFQQGGAVLTVAYSPETNEAGGIQLLGNSLPEGLQVLAALPPEMQLMQQAQAQENKEHLQQTLQHQVFITQNQQILINNGEETKVFDSSNNNNESPGVANIIIKEEFEDNTNDEESSQGTEINDSSTWAINPSQQQDLIKYLSQLTPQQTESLPLPLQQFLRLNTVEQKTHAMEVDGNSMNQDKEDDSLGLDEDDLLQLQAKKKKKYRKKPPKPARPKPGQVVIATAADGSPIFCCPECQMAYPEKEQLEMHLSVHKIERRFICGICGAGLKRKEHLERHKLGHNPERPYVCGVCRKGFKRREHLNLHTVIHSGVKTEMCGLCGKGFYRKDHLRKHTRSHETRRQRDEANSERTPDVSVTVTETPVNNTTIMPEITIHVPTSANINMPVQINIPPHVVSSLAAAQQQQVEDTQSQLDVLLAQHT